MAAGIASTQDTLAPRLNYLDIEPAPERGAVIAPGVHVAPFCFAFGAVQGAYRR